LVNPFAEAYDALDPEGNITMKLLHYLSTQIWQRKTKEEEEEKLSIWIRAVTPPAIPPPYPPLQRVVPVTIQRTEIIT
jgi:hypothetical protein